MLSGQQRRPLGDSTAHNRRPSRQQQQPRSSSVHPKTTSTTRPPTAVGPSKPPAVDEPVVPALRPVRSVPDLRPSSPVNLSTIPPSPSFPPPAAAVTGELEDGRPPTTPPPPQVVFHKEVFIHRHEREFPHLHSRASSFSTSVSLRSPPPGPSTSSSVAGQLGHPSGGRSSSSRPLSVVSLQAHQGPSPSPLLSPPPSPPISGASSLPRKLALPTRALEQWAHHHQHPPASAAQGGPARRPLLTATSPPIMTTVGSPAFPVASFASNTTDSDGSNRQPSSTSAGSHTRPPAVGRGPDDSRSSTEMSSECDLDFAFDPPAAVSTAAGVPLATRARRQPSVVVLHDVRPVATADAVVAGQRRTSFAASVAPSSSGAFTSPETTFGFNGSSPNPSSLYTTPEHHPSPRFASAGKHHPVPQPPALPAPGLARVRSNEHRRGPSISYRFSSPPAEAFDPQQQQQQQQQPGRLSPVKARLPASGSASTMASSEAHRAAWRISDVDDIERELFWRPEDDAVVDDERGGRRSHDKGSAMDRQRISPTRSRAHSPSITPPPTAVTFDRPTATTPANATWPHAAPVRSTRAPLPQVFNAAVRLAPPPPPPKRSTTAVELAKPPPAFPPVLLSRAALAPADLARLDAHPQPPAKVSIVIEPSSPRVPSGLPLPPRSRTTSAGSTAFTSAYSTSSAGSVYLDDEDEDAHATAFQPSRSSHHLRSRSSISRRRQRAATHHQARQDSGLRTHLATAARGSLYDRVDRAVRSPLGMLEHVLPAQLTFWLGFVLGPWCFVLGGWGLASDGSFVLTRLQGARTASRGPHSSYGSHRRPAWGPTARQSSFDSTRSGLWPFRSVLPAPLNSPLLSRVEHEHDRPESPAYNRRRGGGGRRKRWILPALRDDSPNKWVFRNRVAAILSGFVVLPVLVISVIFAIL